MNNWKLAMAFVSLVLGPGFVACAQAPKPPVVSEIPMPDWPPFEMIYKDWSLNRGPNQAGGFVLVKLVYTNRTEWSSQILQDTHNPFGIGKSFGAFPTDPILSRPDDWLEPGMMQKWITQYNATVTPTEIEGINQMTYTEKIPCGKKEKCEFHTIETKAKYWAESDVPMEIIHVRDGVEGRRTTVTDFKWLK